jgi:hypothetical protein
VEGGARVTSFIDLPEHVGKQRAAGRGLVHPKATRNARRCSVGGIPGKRNSEKYQPRCARARWLVSVARITSLPPVLALLREILSFDMQDEAAVLPYLNCGSM